MSKNWILFLLVTAGSASAELITIKTSEKPHTSSQTGSIARLHSEISSIKEQLAELRKEKNGQVVIQYATLPKKESREFIRRSFENGASSIAGIPIFKTAAENYRIKKVRDNWNPYNPNAVERHRNYRERRRQLEKYSKLYRFLQ